MPVKTMLTDWEIAKGILDNNPRIQKQVYADFKRRGFSFLLSMGADEQTSEEIAHEAIKILFFEMNRLDLDKGKLSTYYLSICRNKYFSFRKKSSKTYLVEDSRPFQNLTAQDMEEQDEEWSMRVLREEILLLLGREKENTLKEDCREFLNYQYGERKSLAEIAEIFDYTEKYAKKKAKNSRDYLRKIIIKAIQNRPELSERFHWIA